MGMINGIKELLKRNGGSLDTVDNPDTTEALFVAYVKEELEKRRKSRQGFELQWLLNSNFLLGNQYCDIDLRNSRVCDTETDLSLERSVFNRIAPIADTRMSSLKSVRYLMRVQPASAEYEDQDKAEISTAILRYCQKNLSWDSIKDKAYSWSELTGTAFILSYWNVRGGRSLGSLDGEEIFEGELECGVISPYEIFPENICKEEVEDQRSIIIDQVMSREDIYDKYGTDVQGRECAAYLITPTAGMSAYPSGGRASVLSARVEKVKDSEHVITYFERPSRRYPKGRLGIVIGDRLFFYGALPYEGIPIVSVKCKSIPGQFFGKSFIQELIPIQRAYNGCKNALHNLIKASSGDPLLIPEGSVEDIDDILENGISPNQIIPYKDGMGIPSYLERRGGERAELLSETERLASDMEYTAGVSQLMVYGATPKGMVSGTAIETLRQIDGSRLSLTSENMRSSVKRLAKVWLAIYKRYAEGQRVIETVGGSSSGAVYVWSAEDINSFDVVFDTENELEYSEEQQRQSFIDAYSLGLLNDADGKVPYEIRERMFELMKLGNLSARGSASEKQRQNARNENSLCLYGKLPSVGKYDDHRLHIEEHKHFALQYNLSRLRREGSELCAEFDRHISEHEAALKAEKASASDEERNDT